MGGRCKQASTRSCMRIAFLIREGRAHYRWPLSTVEVAGDLDAVRATFQLATLAFSHCSLSSGYSAVSIRTS